ncbi:hypothetical protein Q1695_003581 [Nippostrongylus brasiliensis]|nr:hypothetical protein Q1695_003581 [Nippostrongylus brasiliensis]
MDLFQIGANLTVSSFMEELKQRLSRTSISSDLDVDRIVKESKTTTITEARETIYFRSRGEASSSGKNPATPEVPSMKRLSILDSEAAERSFVAVSPKRPSVVLNSNDPGERKDSVQGADSVDDLLSEYQNLEKELNDINDKNQELRNKFFEDKKETPVLNSATAVENRHPTLSARIQEWKTSSTRPSGSPVREKKKATFAAGTSDQKAETSSVVLALPPATTKRNGCAFNFIK